VSEPGPRPNPGEEIRALNETLNRRLAALGIFSRSRYDLSPRLNSEDWERLVTLAELGRETAAGK
jgi:hypothetical protein